MTARMGVACGLCLAAALGLGLTRALPRALAARQPRETRETRPAAAREAERDRLAAQVEAVRALAADWPCSDETCDGECSGCAYATDLLRALDDEAAR